MPEIHIEPLADTLAKEFAGKFSRETIEQYVIDCDNELPKGPVQTFRAVFVERFARERLRALAQFKGSIVKEVPEVLFVCVHNAGRSQMAAALLDHIAGDRVHVRSAGSAPADTINPAVVEAMKEVGLDIAKEFPKPLTSEVERAADVIVTMGCGDACTIYPGKRYEDWALDDPAGKSLDGVRPIRDEIERRVVALLASLDAAPR